MKITSLTDLLRVLVVGGIFYFRVPIEKPRLCFNAHRIQGTETILEYCAGLKLMEFSGVHDDGYFGERVSLDELANSGYACGMFWFKKARRQ